MLKTFKKDKLLFELSFLSRSLLSGTSLETVLESSGDML